MTKCEKLWVPHAQKVIDGGYDFQMDSFLKSILIGVENIDDPTCREATEKLKLMRSKVTKYKKE